MFCLLCPLSCGCCLSSLDSRARVLLYLHTYVTHLLVLVFGLFLVLFISALLSSPLLSSSLLPNVLLSADGFRSTRAAYVKVWLELERKNMDQAQSELEVELLWGQLDRREKELNMSKIGAR